MLVGVVAAAATQAIGALLLLGLLAAGPVAFAAYVALFRGVLGGVDIAKVRRRLDWRASYQITMAGLAATRVFSAAGAGGIVLTYWALRKAGLPTRRAACRSCSVPEPAGG